MYNLPANYVSRLEPDYFEDTLDDSALWQADVYRLAAQLAREAESRLIIDIGCGRGEKLTQFGNEFETFGIDYGSNIAQTPESERHFWRVGNLNEEIIEPKFFDRTVAICADVIEHLPDPTALIETLRNACSTAEYVLVSTPDRDRVYKGKPHFGPPVNQYHVREWTLAELREWFVSVGLPVKWGGWTISNDKRPDQVWTSLLVLSNKHEITQLPINYQPAPDYRKMAKRRKQDSALKVWMTPTPSEAGRDTTNAINQIVCRLDEHLPDFGVELVEHPDNATVYAAHAGQGSPAPIHVAHYHGLYNTAGGHDAHHFFAINSHVIRNLRTAKIITAPSEWIADLIRRDMHINPEIIGWGVDVDEWTPAENPGLYAIWNKARVDAVSDPAPMLELAKRVPNMPFLTTFGEGTPNVKTIGRQPYGVMKNYVRNASVYLATVTETFGIATLEAMAAGVPVLGFRHGNTAHLVEHGITGFLAEPNDIDGLIEGLIYCMKYRDRLGANAREAARQHTWGRVAAEMARVYWKTLEPHQGKKVSIVIPCHNYAEYVGEAIESALAQEANFEYEIIVVLDRCTDTSAAVVGRYAERGVQAVTVDNGSLSQTRNDGITLATGEFIVLLDADDRLGDPRFLQTLSDALDNDRTLGIAFTGITVMNADGVLGHKNPWPKGYDFDLQAQRRNQVPSCCMFRRQAWERAGGFRPWFKYAEDAEFWLTVGAIGYGAKQVTEAGWFHYRLHNKSASQVHRTGEVHEPDWTEFQPWTKDNERPFAAGGKPPLGSWPVRYYLKPDVSIIIPVGKGHEQSVRDALHSVEGQTHRQWECIVVNDSPDDLDLTGFPWAQMYTTRGLGNNGAGAARNLGASFANAPFLVFLDADDILKPQFLELTLKAYRQHGRYAYTDWMTDDRRGKTAIHRTAEYSMDAVWQSPSLHPVTALIPRKWFLDVGGFDEQMDAYEDVDLYMKLLTRGYCGVRVDEPLLVYNLETGQRRKRVEKDVSRFKTLLTGRYREFMEGTQMCDCVDPPKGKTPVPPTPENAGEYKAAYGDMVKVQLTWEFAGLSPTTFRGPATKVFYGARAKGDIFHIWEADLINSQGVFTKLDAYEVEPVPTVVPPPPERLDTFPGIPVREGNAPSSTDEKPVIETLLDNLSKREMVEYAAEHDIELQRKDLKNRETMIAAILEALAARV